ncbi:MAG TPA: hypothetical protein VGR64_00120 [Terracidiphilus sp.]|nr:hypothetical protein [Terracidiphilus sp.]
MRSMFCVAAVLLSVSLAVPAVRAESASTCNPEALNECSYTITNGRCKVTFDRRSPATPPTIYAHPDAEICVVVVNNYPLEQLTVDLKSSSIVLRPDTFQTLFNSISANLGKVVLTFSTQMSSQMKGRFVQTIKDPCALQPGGLPCALDTIAAGQIELASTINGIHPYEDLRPQFDELSAALLPPTGLVDSTPNPLLTCTTSRCVRSELKKIENAFEYNLGQSNINKCRTKWSGLDNDLANAQASSASSLYQPQIKTLKDNQAMLDKQISALEDETKRLKALSDGLGELDLDQPDSPVFMLPPPESTRGNSLSTSWTLNSTNQLLPLVKRVTADKLTDEDSYSFSNLATPPAKQAIVTVTVQYQSPSPLEFATGVAFPVTPYHSYAAGQETTDNLGTIVAKESKTYTVVPMALVHYRLGERHFHGNSTAFFATGGIGVNVSTTQVEGAVGATWSFRTLALSFLCDIGRDTHLGAGLKPNHPLGVYTAPPTTTSISFKPAIAISVRIPLGGGGSSSASGSN